MMSRSRLQARDDGLLLGDPRAVVGTPRPTQHALLFVVDAPLGAEIRAVLGLDGIDGLGLIHAQVESGFQGGVGGGGQAHEEQSKDDGGVALDSHVPLLCFEVDPGFVRRDWATNHQHAPILADAAAPDSTASEPCPDPLGSERSDAIPCTWRDR
jgi:hypothetical protein